MDRHNQPAKLHYEVEEQHSRFRSRRGSSAKAADNLSSNIESLEEGGIFSYGSAGTPKFTSSISGNNSPKQSPLGRHAVTNPVINVRPSGPITLTNRASTRTKGFHSTSTTSSSSGTTGKTKYGRNNEVDIYPAQDLKKPAPTYSCKSHHYHSKNRSRRDGFFIENEVTFTTPKLNNSKRSIIEKSASKCTLDGLGFDLETIDLTNDMDRKVKLTKRGDRATKCGDDDGDDYENPDSCYDTSSAASSSDTVSENNSTAEEDQGRTEDEKSESNDECGNISNTNTIEQEKSTTARRYISVESLVLEDNFDARSLPSSSIVGGKNRCSSDEDYSGINNKSNSSGEEEIPQVKVVWNTPPGGSPRSCRTRKSSANNSVHEIPSDIRSQDPNHDSILNFFTRTEEGVEKEGRYENVEPVISKFFTHTTEQETGQIVKCIKLKQVMDNIDEFVLQPAAIGYDIQCRVTRDRKGVDRGLYPTYYMHLERPDGRKILLLTGRKRKKSTTSNYLISTDASDLSRDSTHFVGKVRSNLLGTQFIIYDNGQSQKKLGLFQSYGSEQPLREQLAAVIYEPNVLGFKGPRKMKVLIPEMKNETKRHEHRPDKEKDSILELHKQEEDGEFFELRNKAPIWNDDNQSFVLNFHGRVTQASVKNFQIIHEKKEDYVILQFGRVASDLFTMDYRYPLCALQAFAIVLTSFDNKLACE